MIPIVIAKVFRRVKAIFLGEENQRPWFMCNQNMPVKPKVNQLPKSAVFQLRSPSQYVLR
jgi:hypothetical protein